MKSTGIVRRLDDLGRVVLPVELRRNMNIAEGDPMEIFTDGDRIILRKYQPGCVNCGSCEDLKYLGKVKVCNACLQAVM